MSTLTDYTYLLDENFPRWGTTSVSYTVLSALPYYYDNVNGTYAQYDARYFNGNFGAPNAFEAEGGWKTGSAQPWHARRHRVLAQFLSNPRALQGALLHPRNRAGAQDFSGVPIKKRRDARRFGLRMANRGAVNNRRHFCAAARGGLSRFRVARRVPRARENLPVVHDLRLTLSFSR